MLTEVMLGIVHTTNTRQARRRGGELAVAPWEPTGN